MDATTPARDRDAPSTDRVRAAFAGEADRFFRLAVIGNLLQIPTFGF